MLKDRSEPRFIGVKNLDPLRKNEILRFAQNDIMRFFASLRMT